MTPAGTGSGGRESRGWGTAVAGGLCLVALGGYALFLLSDRPDPVPAHPPASFGLSVAGATDPAAFQATGDISLTVTDLDSPQSSAEWEVTFRAGSDTARPVDGTLYFALPAQAAVTSLRTLTLPAGMEQSIGADQVVTDAVLDRNPGQETPGRATPVGTLDGRPLTVLPDDTAPEGGPPVRILRVPVAARAGTVTVELLLTAPTALFAGAGRVGETAFAVDFGTTAAALRAAPDARPLGEFTSPLEPANLVLSLGYPVALTETEVAAVPPVGRTTFEAVIWAEEVTEDSRLRVDGVLVDVPARHWLGLLDNAALLLLGAMVAVVIDRLLRR